jgi:hypothetical protein
MLNTANMTLEDFMEFKSKDEDAEYLLKFLKDNPKIAQSYVILVKVGILVLLCIPFMCGIYAWLY